MHPDSACSCPPCRLEVRRFAPLDDLVYLGPCPACSHGQALVGIAAELVRSGEPSPLHEALVGCGLPCPREAIDQGLLERLRQALDREEGTYDSGLHRPARN